MNYFKDIFKSILEWTFSISKILFFRKIFIKFTLFDKLEKCEHLKQITRTQLRLWQTRRGKNMLSKQFTRTGSTCRGARGLIPETRRKYLRFNDFDNSWKTKVAENSKRCNVLPCLRVWYIMSGSYDICGVKFSSKFLKYKITSILVNPKKYK